MLWAQRAAEFEAIGLQVYLSGLRLLDTAMSDPAWTAISSKGTSPAVVVDVDETIADTTAAQTELVRTGAPYDQETFDRISNNVSRPIPGAKEFLAEAARRGAAVFYVSNRRAASEAGLRTFLSRHGFPLSENEDRVLLRGENNWTSRDKSGRREFVASKYRLIMLFGDDLNDFVAAEGKTPEERLALVAQNRDKWGRSWFMLPNPHYGSWERALGVSDDVAPCDRIRRKIELLK
ncbi:MAG TPA: HAD family acid phosphatase [Thermoanaerobaculia bacterium]|nr:HAD family acid phosphatase [Thermoanaerobaculia bacterium]